MNASKRTFQLCLVLIMHCCLVETMGLCEFEEMFPDYPASSTTSESKVTDTQPMNTNDQRETTDEPSTTSASSTATTAQVTDTQPMNTNDQRESTNEPSTTSASSTSTTAQVTDTQPMNTNDQPETTNGPSTTSASSASTTAQGTTMIATDCYDLYNDHNVTSDGVYIIHPTGWTDPGGFQVYCRMSTNGGGWTVFQYRNNRSVSFYRTWSEYKEGFGNLSGDHWLGNDKLHILATQRNYQLRVDLTKSGGTSNYAYYNTFSVGDEDSKYQLTRKGTYGGNAGNLKYRFKNGTLFSTYDRDNDLSSSYNCAEKHRSGWWFPFFVSKNDNDVYNWNAGGTYWQCTGSNLNGDYNGGRGQKLFWRYGYNDWKVQTAELRIRPHN